MNANDLQECRHLPAPLRTRRCGDDLYQIRKDRPSVLRFTSSFDLAPAYRKASQLPANAFLSPAHTRKADGISLSACYSKLDLHAKFSRFPFS
jgi:hypothetical protein